MQIADLVQDLLRAQANDEATGLRAAGAPDGRGRAMFLIGAGCSVSAGIPLASEVARRAVIGLAVTYRPADPSQAETPIPATAEESLAALVEGGHFPRRFLPDDAPPSWGELYSYIFSDHIKHPNDQRAFIASLVETRNLGLNWSHACLGELVKRRFVHTVLTTNFDQLVLKGIIRTGIIPVVADGLESLSRISATPSWPQVVHVHGSMHTYELRNSYNALRETGDDRGLQSLMLSILKETTVFVVVGYSGGEEGVMSLLEEAAKSLPRMVVYWIAFEPDYALLSGRARALLETGEHKYFVLGQESDDFFNKLLGELGVGPPGWIKRPLEVLAEQVQIMSADSTSDDVRGLIKAYETRVAYAGEHGVAEDTPDTLATELSSANRFREAAEMVSADGGYRDRDDSLRIHAVSLFNQYNRMREPDEGLLRSAIEELELLVSRDGEKVVSDTETLIEARRDLYEGLDHGIPERTIVAEAIAASAEAAQAKAGSSSRHWAVMEFYKAEASHLRAEQLKHVEGGTEPEGKKQRAEALRSARTAYQAALPILAHRDVERARECKEGLAGALSGLAEIEPRADLARAYLRQAKALFQEVVEFARRNTPGRQFAGALENLAGVVEATATRYPEEAHNSRNEAKRLLHFALEIYGEIDDSKGVRRMQMRLEPYESV